MRKAYIVINLYSMGQYPIDGFERHYILHPSIKNSPHPIPSSPYPSASHSLGGYGRHYTTYPHISPLPPHPYLLTPIGGHGRHYTKYPTPHPYLPTPYVDTNDINTTYPHTSPPP